MFGVRAGKTSHSIYKRAAGTTVYSRVAGRPDPYEPNGLRTIGHPALC
jgi:hypothetical protein